MGRYKFIILLIIINCFLFFTSCQSNDQSSFSPKQVEPSQQDNYIKESITPSPNVNGKQPKPIENITWYPRQHKYLAQLWGKNVVDSSFIDSMNGWMIARQEQGKVVSDVDIFQTKDGGSTWSKIAISDESVPAPDKNGNTPSGTLPISYEIEWISFLDENTGWVSGSTMYGKLNSPCIYITHDGGHTWKNTKLLIPDSAKRWIDNATSISIMPIQFFTRSDGFFILDIYKGEIKRRYLYITHDSGDSWGAIYEITEPEQKVGTSANLSWNFSIPESTKVTIGSDIWIADTDLINWKKQSN